MIKQPLKEYLEKIVEYKTNSNNDPRRRWRDIQTYDNKYELLKFIPYNYFNIIPKRLFNRYMNNTMWEIE